MEKDHKKPWEKRKETGASVDFSIQDCPMWIYKEFTSDINKYNDTYWVKLMDLQRKAKAYDYLMAGIPEEEPMPELPEEEIKKDRYGVATVGGFSDFSEEVKEKIKKEQGEKKND